MTEVLTEEKRRKQPMRATTKTKGDRTMPPAINDEQTSAAKDGSYHTKDFHFYFQWEPHWYGYEMDATPNSMAWLWKQFPETFRLFLQEQGWTADTFGGAILKTVLKGQSEGIKPSILKYPTDSPTAQKWKQEAKDGDTDYKVWAAQARKEAVAV